MPHGRIIVVVVVGALSCEGAVVVAPVPVVRSHLVRHGGRDSSYDLCHGVPPHDLSAVLHRTQNCRDQILKYRRVGIDRGRGGTTAETH